ncbi:MAG: hypothetical protein GY809_24985 [Planctomycetes bacterium]|nr:hypothetical protein [Planctomycetota bacterium]
MKARIQKATLFLILGVTGSAMALSPIGPAQAVIGEKQWGVGFNVGYQSMDLVTEGTYFEYQSPTLDTQAKLALENTKSISSFVQIGLGLSPECDIYGLIGTSDAQGDATVRSNPAGVQTHGFSNGEGFDINGDHELAWGIGTRFTLRDDETVRWGGVVQMTWQSPKGNSTWAAQSGGGYTIDGTWKLDTWELIVALGPTIVYDNVQFYGGPFLHLVRGNLDFNGTYSGGDTGVASTSQKVEEESQVGVYGGMQMDLYENVLLYVDGQFTGKALGIGLGAMVRTK